MHYPISVLNTHFYCVSLLLFPPNNNPFSLHSTEVARNIRNKSLQIVSKSRVGSVTVFKNTEKSHLKVRFPRGMSHEFIPANQSAAHEAASCTVSLHENPTDSSELPSAQAEDLPEELALLFVPVGPANDPPGLFALRQFKQSEFPRVHFHLLRFNG